jgi:hypothetical protein
MERTILDSHTHCGHTVPYEALSKEWERGEIHGGVRFSPVEEIYDRYDPHFTDSEEYRASRASVHRYLLKSAERDRIFSYFFVWNDFAPIPDGFVGIKWHRHSNEPVYRYDDPACERTLSEICDKRLPIVLEEEFDNTLRFIERIAERTVVIIPHMGALNGGYWSLKRSGVFESPAVWTDTALAGDREISDFAKDYGTERIMFGSDYPFGAPAQEKRKPERLFSDDDLDRILGGNLLRLLGRE